MVVRGRIALWRGAELRPLPLHADCTARPCDAHDAIGYRAPASVPVPFALGWPAGYSPFVTVGLNQFTVPVRRVTGGFVSNWTQLHSEPFLE